jgi:signal transduction histidine kinase
LCYFQLKKYNKALFYYKEALQFLGPNSKKYSNNQKSIKEAIGVVYGNLGDVYKEKMNWSLAKDSYQKNVNINMKSGYDIANAQLSYISLAELLLREKRMDSAYMALAEIKTSLDKISTKKGEVEWNRVMWQYYVQKGSSKEAYNYLEEFHNKKEEWLTTDNDKNLIDLSKQYDLFEDQTKVANLKVENSLKNLYLVITIFIAVVASAFLVFIWLSWKTSKKNVLKLNKLMQTILIQNGELEFAFMSLSESTADREKLINLVAHDLRAPIAGISILTTLIGEEENESERQYLMSLMRESCTNALGVVDDTLKSSSNVTTYEGKTTIGINSFIAECTPLLEILATKKQIRIGIDLPEHDISVDLDSGKFKRVINNLVVNAIKFSLPGSKIKIVVRQEKHLVVIAVKDRGIGIAANQVDKLFDGGHSHKRVGTDGEPSCGLGLSFCKHVVVEHNGEISVKSIEGKGSTFYIKLPTV